MGMTKAVRWVIRRPDFDKNRGSSGGEARKPKIRGFNQLLSDFSTALTDCAHPSPFLEATNKGLDLQSFTLSLGNNL